VAWFRSPVKLFGSIAVSLFFVRTIFPPSDQGYQLQAYVHFQDARIDLNGYGVFEFVGVVFVVSALAYYVLPVITKRPIANKIVQLHFWPSFLFAIWSVLLAEWVSRIPKVFFQNPGVRDSVSRYMAAFTWTFIIFLLMQTAFAVAALYRLWSSRSLS